MTPQQVINNWRLDPVQFVRDHFNEEPDLWQKVALKAFASSDSSTLRITLKACAGPGKSAVLAWCGWNFLLCYGNSGQHPKGAAVSITNDNLKDNLWAEFNKWQQRSPILQKAFTWTSTRIFANDHPETWFLSARSWPKTANEEDQGLTLSGLHSEYVLYLIDESGGIPLSVLKAAEQGLSNCVFGRIIQAGNPITMTGMLYTACTTQADKWQVISVSGDPEDPMRSPRINIDWAKEQIKLYGRNDPWVMAYILGQFPPSAINAILSVEEIEQAQRREIPDGELVNSERRMGIDVARFGDDRTFIARRHGLQALQGYTMRGATGPDIAGRVASIMDSWTADQIFLDSTGGYGGSPEDALRQGGYHPIPVNFSGKAYDDKFFNIRSQILWSLADWVKRGGCLPRSQSLAKELSVITYTFQNGKIRIVEKERMKEALGFSPDEADAYALTFALPDKPRIRYSHRGTQVAKVFVPHCARRRK